uniref:Uncharacterized protein n=1 Tax=Arundo donax TaxID=35708 RepID=A0A0A9FWX3_ARUDO
MYSKLAKLLCCKSIQKFAHNMNYCQDFCPRVSMNRNC